ncbi:MAG: insulinase family protein [bacterium]|nr:insulinase family protein [bacterium]
MRIFSILLVVALFASPAFAQEGAIKEFTLDNGLKVILKENHDAPVVNFNMAFRVGSKHERPGITGIAHLLEHIMFKSTATRPLGDFDRMLSEVGADNNANTWLDRTIYYETIAADKVDIALQLDADRMRNMLFIAEEHKLEMPVVRNELEQRNDSPQTLLYEEMLTMAFKAHPYSIPTIGWVDDVEGITTPDIKEFYDRWYHPDNAFIVATGDFNTDELLAKIKKYFGPIPASGVKQPRLPVEPVQNGERRFELKRAGQLDYMMAGWHIPEAEHTDSFALVILGDILGSGRTSRLYKAVVDSGKTAEAWAGSEAFDYGDPFLFMAGATMNPGVAPGEVEPLLLAEIERLKTGGITDAELARAKKQARAAFVYREDSIVAQSNSLISFEMYNSGWRNYFNYLPGIEAVTAADVQRVAQTYLTADNRTVGYYLAIREQDGGPAVGAPAEASRVKPEPLHYKPEGATEDSQIGFAGGLPSAPTIAASDTGSYANVFTLPNGLTVVVRENHSNPSVSISGLVRAGSIDDPADKPGLANLAVSMLKRGTAKWTKEQLAELEENNAVSLGYGPGRENFSFSGRSLSEDLPTLLDLLQSTLLQPTFPQTELDLLRQQVLAAIADADNDTATQAGRAARRALYGDDNPFTHDEIGTVESVQAATVDDIAAWYSAHSVPEGSIITIVGDVSAAQVRSEIERRLGSWSGKLGNHNALIARASDFRAPATPNVDVFLADKSNVSLIWAGPGASRQGTAWPKYSVATYVLGGDFGSRLNKRLRVQEGLTYGSFAFFDSNLAAGPLFTQADVNPENIAAAEKAMTEELTKYAATGPTEEEFRRAKSFLTGNYPVRLASNGSIARELTTNVYLGRGVDYIRDYPGLVEAVTLQEVLGVIRDYIDQSKMVHVRAGTLPGQ